MVAVFDVLRMAADMGQYVALILLDLSAAFEHSALVNCVERIGIKGTALKLIRSFLSNREQVVALEGFLVGFLGDPH